MTARISGVWRALVALIAMAASSHAFLVQTVEGPDGPVQQLWNSGRNIPFVIHQAGSDDLPPDAVHRVLRESFRIWEEVPTAAISFVDRGLTSTLTPSETDGNNLVIFDESNSWLQAPRNSGIIAAAFVETKAHTGEITDVDIVFNGRDFRFGTTADAGGTVDLGDVAVHEIGHLLGLDHSPLEDRPGSLPTMVPFYSPVRGAGATLEADDRAGASYLYPNTSLFRFGSIAGAVTDIDGAPQFGVHVVAENIANGDRIGTVTGAYPGTGRGEFILFGLPAGEYVVRIEAIEGSVNENNFGGIFRDFSAGFPAEYLGNVNNKDLARTLTVTPGQQLAAVDFITGFRRPGFPHLASVAHPSNTPDTEGPYVVRVEVEEAAEALLRFRSGDGAPREVKMRAIGGGLYETSIPGQPTGTQISYQVRATNAAGKTTFLPQGEGYINFEVVALSGSPLAFVALRDDDRIQIIDTGDQRLLARVEVGDEPIQVLLTRDGQKLFVSTLGSSEIAILETRTFRLLDRLEVALQPLDMSLSADGRTLYVTNSGAAAITAIDVATHAITGLRLSQIGRGPYGIAAGGTGSNIYVTDIGRAQVIALDGTGRELRRIDVPDVPRSLALSPDGTRLYVTSLGSGELTVIGIPENEIVATVTLPAASAFAVEPSPDGRKVYLTANEEGVLIVVDAIQNAVLKTIQIGANPRDITISPQGDRVFVTNAASNEIFVLDARNDVVLEVYSAAGTPRGIAIANPPTPTAVAEFATSVPVAFVLHPSYPNPFNAETLLRYAVDESAAGATAVKLQVFNLLGQRIRTLVDDLHPAGSFRAFWDGTDGRGRNVASGVYLAVLSGRGEQVSTKMVLVR